MLFLPDTDTCGTVPHVRIVHVTYCTIDGIRRPQQKATLVLGIV